MKHPLSQRKFRKWLQGRHANEVVGIANKTTSCPCATCIVDVNPHLKGRPVRVLYDTTEIGGTWGGQRVPNPNWLRRFTAKVDAGHSGYAPITAGTARRIFRQVTRPEKVAA